MVAKVPTRLLSALLIGINRAFPFVGGTEHTKELLAQYQTRLWPLIHSDNFRTSTQALNLLFQAERGSSSSGMPSLRFYRALYARIGSVELRTASRPAVFFNLAYRAIVACGKLPKDAPPLAKRKATRCASALLKRLLQAATHSRAHFTAGSLIIASASLAKNGALRKQLVKNHASEARKANQASEAADGTRAAVVTAQTASDADATASTSAASSSAPASTKTVAEKTGKYEVASREPVFCGAGGEPLWELAILERHFNPSVRAFASSLQRGKGEVVYGGDPLVQLTRMAFLDRFAYRKPKQKELDAARDVEEMKRSSAMGARGGRARLRASASDMTADSESFALAAPSEVDEHERFMHRFAQLKRAKSEGVERSAALAEVAVEWGDDGSGGEESEGSDGSFSSMDDEDGGLDAELEAEARVAQTLISDGARAEIEDSGDDDNALDSESDGVDFEGLPKFSESEDEDDEEDESGNDDEDDGEVGGAERRKRAGFGRAGPRAKKLRTSVFAAAEDFQEMLDADDQKEIVLDRDDFTTRRERTAMSKGLQKAQRKSSGGGGKKGKGGGRRGGGKRRR